MEIFYNQERSGYEEIVSYGPSWWTEYREMNANVSKSILPFFFKLEH